MQIANCWYICTNLNNKTLCFCNRIRLGNSRQVGQLYGWLFHFVSYMFCQGWIVPLSTYQSESPCKHRKFFTIYGFFRLPPSHIFSCCPSISTLLVKNLLISKLVSSWPYKHLTYLPPTLLVSLEIP